MRQNTKQENQEAKQPNLLPVNAIKIQDINSYARSILLPYLGDTTLRISLFCLASPAEIRKLQNAWDDLIKIIQHYRPNKQKLIKNLIALKDYYINLGSDYHKGSREESVNLALNTPRMIITQALAELKKIIWVDEYGILEENIPQNTSAILNTNGPLEVDEFIRYFRECRLLGPGENRIFIDYSDTSPVSYRTRYANNAFRLGYYPGVRITEETWWSDANHHSGTFLLFCCCPCNTALQIMSCVLSPFLSCMGYMIGGGCDVTDNCCRRTSLHAAMMDTATAKEDTSRLHKSPISSSGTHTAYLFPTDIKTSLTTMDNSARMSTPSSVNKDFSQR